MKWIKRKGTLRVSEILTLGYGDDIPKGAIGKKRLETFKELGYVGDIIENIAEHPEVRALKAVISRRDEKIKELEAQIEELKKPPAELDEDGNPIVPPEGDDK